MMRQAGLNCKALFRDLILFLTQLKTYLFTEIQRLIKALANSSLTDY